MEQPQTAMFNNKGVTLIEMMISLVILLVVSLALMQTSILGMKTNAQNVVRDEAVNVAEMRINQLRSLPFPVAPAINDLTATINALDTQQTRTFRGFTTTYAPSRTVTDLNADSKQITISVSWTYGGRAFSHTVTTIMRRR